MQRVEAAVGDKDAGCWVSQNVVLGGPVHQVHVVTQIEICIA